MKKTAKIVFLMLLATILCFSLFACNHKDASDHKPTGDWKSDATHHWHACENDKCADAGDKAEHVYDNACDTTCNVCQATRNITHSHADTLTAGDTTHYYLCSVCGDKVGATFKDGVATIYYNQKHHFFRELGVLLQNIKTEKEFVEAVKKIVPKKKKLICDFFK